MTSDPTIPTTEELAAMRAWCEDSFSDMRADATDDEVVMCVHRQYDGGLSGFIVDSQPSEIR